MSGGAHSRANDCYDPRREGQRDRYAPLESLNQYDPSYDHNQEVLEESSESQEDD